MESQGVPHRPAYIPAQLVDILSPSRQSQLLEYTLKTVSLDYDYFQFEDMELMNLLNTTGWDQEALRLYLMDVYCPLESEDPTADSTCLICYSEIHEAYEESCGHSFCRECYSMHVVTQFGKGL